jgi:branched-chain amino acid aminotransferase
MSVLVHIRGRIVSQQEAVVPVFDRGFLFGDSVYETLACFRRKPVFLLEHLDRLEKSAQRIALSLPSRLGIEKAIFDLIATSDHEDSRLRIIVTRGVGSLELDPASATHPELILICQPMNPPTREMLDRGVSVGIVGFSRGSQGGMDPAVKSGNYITSVLAMGEVRRRDPAIHEAILTSPEGIITEGATSNIFVVKESRLRTPALSVGILAGVTRGKVLALAGSTGISTDESARICVQDLTDADEIFLTSAVRGILPVTAVDGATVGTGRPGPVTQKLLAIYQRLVKAAE